MKKIFFLSLVLFLSIASQAQKFAYIDTEYILSKVPEYQEAQKQLDALSEQWQKQTEKRYEAIEKMYKDLQAEEILLTESMKNKRQEEIIKKEQEARDFQKQKFGIDGELFKKRKELIKPIQEKIYKAVQETANVGKYSVIFDKASDATMVYSNPKYDKSDDILRRMGIKPEGDSK
ncbi:MAG: outer membrane protein [Vicingaceae bacterium]|jgi:outer membrane protein